MLPHSRYGGPDGSILKNPNGHHINTGDTKRHANFETGSQSSISVLDDSSEIPDIIIKPTI